MKKSKTLLKLFVITIIAAMFIPYISYGAGGLSGNLKLQKSYPEDGQSGFEPVNMVVKLWFDGDVSDISVQDINKNAFSIKNTSGTSVKFDVLFNDEDRERIWLLPIDTLESDTEYIVTIDKSLASVGGRVFGTNQNLTFKTRDVNAGNLSSMIMMLAMIAIMVGYSFITSKRQAAKEAKNQTEKVNPYKTAKQKNTSVEKVIKNTQKTKGKASKGKSDKTNADQDKSVSDKANKPVSDGPQSGEKGAISPSSGKSSTDSPISGSNIKVNKGKVGNIARLNKKSH